MPKTTGILFHLIVLCDGLRCGVYGTSCYGTSRNAIGKDVSLTASDDEGRPIDQLATYLDPLTDWCYESIPGIESLFVTCAWVWDEMP